MRIAVFAVLVAACAERPYPGPPELTLGFGETELVPIEDGDRVPITIAPQGGKIVWGAASVRYVDPQDLELVYTLTPPDGRTSLRRVVVDADDADDGFARCTLPGHPVFVLDEARFAGLPCTFRLEVRDRDGRSASVERTIIPTPSDPPS